MCGSRSRLNEAGRKNPAIEKRKPILHIAPSRHRPAFSPIAEEHESENASPF